MRTNEGRPEGPALLQVPNAIAVPKGGPPAGKASIPATPTGCARFTGNKKRRVLFKFDERSLVTRAEFEAEMKAEGVKLLEVQTARGPILLPVLAAVLLLTGCTVFKVRQSDEAEGGLKRVTSVTGIAWFSSAQAITKLKATTSDKTQSIGTDTFGQQGATNSVLALQYIARILEALRPAP